MILVNFKGRGEWFIRDGNCIKLAIPRATKQPYQDPLEWKTPENHIPDYQDWLGYGEDNNENFSEWVKLSELVSHNKQTLPDSAYTFDSKEYKYDHDLKGIFIRDPDVKGNIYNTNGLRSYGANYLSCDEIIGVFRLDDDDEDSFRLANFDPKKDWDTFKTRIKKLLPGVHPKSAFLKKVNEGKLSNDDVEHVYFEIQSQHHFDFYGESTPIKYGYDLDFVSMDDGVKAAIAENYPNTEGPHSKPKDPQISINKLAEVVLVMAIDKYSYNPDSPLIKVYKSIQESLKLKNLQINIEDIKQCLSYGFDVYQGKKMLGNSKFNRQATTDIELNIFLKLVLGMAIVAYGYDPFKKGKNNITGQKHSESIAYIISKHKTHPIIVDKGSIKKYLDEAKKMLPIQSQ